MNSNEYLRILNPLESRWCRSWQVRDAGSPPLVADTWLTMLVNCSRPAAARAPAGDVIGRSQLGGMLVVVVMATIASALLLICVLAATVVLRHCTSANNLRTASKPEPRHHVTSAGTRTAVSAGRNELRLQVARDAIASRDYGSQSRYPPRYNSLKTSFPQRCLTSTSTTPSDCSSVGRVYRPMAAGRSDHVTPSGWSHQMPVTSSLTDDVRYRLLYGANVVPAVHHSVRIVAVLQC